MKGLAVLGRMPASLEYKESLITQILAISSKGLKEAASEQVHDLASLPPSFLRAKAVTQSGPTESRWATP